MPSPLSARRAEVAPAAPVLTPVPPMPTLTDDDWEAPEPSPLLVGALAVQGYEVLAGIRTVAQLGPLVSVALARRLSTVRAMRNDRRLVYRDERRVRPRLGRVRVDRPAPGIAEAAVVLHVGHRALAVALRLEWAHRHWRAAELVVL